MPNVMVDRNVCDSQKRSTTTGTELRAGQMIFVNTTNATASSQIDHKPTEARFQSRDWMNRPRASKVRYSVCGAVEIGGIASIFFFWFVAVRYRSYSFEQRLESAKVNSRAAKHVEIPQGGSRA